MLPHEWWGSWHEVTEGAAMRSIAVEGADCESFGNSEILNLSNTSNNQSLNYHISIVFANDYQNNYISNQTQLITNFLDILGFIILFFIVICYVVRGGYNPFIYFNF